MIHELTDDQRANIARPVICLALASLEGQSDGATVLLEGWASVAEQWLRGAPKAIERIARIALGLAWEAEVDVDLAKLAARRAARAAMSKHLNDCHVDRWPLTDGAFVELEDASEVGADVAVAAYLAALESRGSR